MERHLSTSSTLVLRKAVAAGLLALGLGSLLIGVEIVHSVTITNLDDLFYLQPTNLAIFVGSVFLGYLLISWIGQHRKTPKGRSQEVGIMDRFAAKIQHATPVLAPVMIGFAVLLPFMPFADRYVIDTATLILTYVMLGWGLNIVVGLAGLLDLGYVAFYAVGAYSCALLAMNFDANFWVALPFAGAFAAVSGVILGFPILRLRGDYLAIVTLGFGEIIRIVLLNWQSVTNGPDGIGGIPRPSFFGFPFKRNPSEETVSFHQLFDIDFSSMHRIIFLYYLILVLALMTSLITTRLRRLPIGRAWEALREDETACRSLGINPRNVKLTAFATGAMFGGFAGAFFAARQGFISPESFVFMESAIILAIVVLGGMGSQIGIVFAAIIFIGGAELFREFEQARMLIFGAAMVAVMIWRPRGLLAHRDPTLNAPKNAHHM